MTQGTVVPSNYGTRHHRLQHSRQEHPLPTLHSWQEAPSPPAFAARGTIALQHLKYKATTPRAVARASNAPQHLWQEAPSPSSICGTRHNHPQAIAARGTIAPRICGTIISAVVTRGTIAPEFEAEDTIAPQNQWQEAPSSPELVARGTRRHRPQYLWQEAPLHPAFGVRGTITPRIRSKMHHCPAFDVFV